MKTASSAIIAKAKEIGATAFPVDVTINNGLLINTIIQVVPETLFNFVSKIPPSFLKNKKKTAINKKTGLLLSFKVGEKEGFLKTKNFIVNNNLKESELTNILGIDYQSIDQLGLNYYVVATKTETYGGNYYTWNRAGQRSVDLSQRSIEKQDKSIYNIYYLCII